MRYLLILVVFIGCTKQTTVTQTRKECSCSQDYVIKYQAREIKGVCYVPYYSTYRSGLNWFYEYEITDCKGSAIVKKRNPEGKLLNSWEYQSTDQVKDSVETFQYDSGEYDTTKLTIFYPELIKVQNTSQP